MCTATSRIPEEATGAGNTNTRRLHHRTGIAFSMIFSLDKFGIRAPRIDSLLVLLAHFKISTKCVQLAIETALEAFYLDLPFSSLVEHFKPDALKSLSSCGDCPQPSRFLTDCFRLPGVAGLHKAHQPWSQFLLSSTMKLWTWFPLDHKWNVFTLAWAGARKLPRQV